jgi:aspartate aminotransferase-like enzyme
MEIGLAGMDEHALYWFFTPSRLSTSRTVRRGAYSFATLSMRCQATQVDGAYRGKVTDADPFRIGTIGDVHSEETGRLLTAIGEVGAEMGFAP